jgi:DNA invertase Pin-like site-specific DNA recombinase
MQLPIMYSMASMNRRPARRSAGNPSLAVAYLRVSTEDQNLGPQAQRSAIERWAASRGVTAVAWFEDHGKSGAAPADERPALMAALAALREHGAGLLVAAKRDRIARDVVVAATVEQLAHDHGARVVTADGVSVEQTPEGALMRGLLDLFAAYERSVIRARTSAALAAKRQRGERVSGRAPLGFRFDGGRLVEDAAEVAMLASIRDLRGKGLSLARIASILTAEGVTLRGGRIHVTTLARALSRGTGQVAA